MTEKTKIGIVRCREQAILPRYIHEGDAGMDITAAEDLLLGPGETAAVATGLKFLLPAGWEIQVRPRSGLSLKTPLRVANAPGTIDAGFRDEVKIILYNASCPVCNPAEAQPYRLNESGNKKGTYLIKAGDRIAQLVFARTERVELTEEVEALLADAEITANRGGGLGHSGI